MNGSLTIGQKVMFGRENGEKTLGTIVGINAKSVKVRQDEARGGRPVGTEWRVHPSLVSPVDGVAAPAPAASPAVTRRAEDAVMRDILNAYSDLSPENLTCDGELRGRAVATRRAAINRRLAALQAELGRRVSEDEAWHWYTRKNPGVWGATA